MAGPLLFAYGTLRDALQRDVVLHSAPTRELGTGSAAGVLYDLGNYPGLVSGASDERVPGVVVELPDDAALTRLDAYEDIVNGLFVRRRTTVRLDAGGDVEAWVYLYNRSVRGRRRITSWGDATE
ncbi:MAG TPA: gamma-glutamylcyclotransferase family protein [Candidatus Dormibacteraeota bacterium]|nr:gamma-glutamylcyclotransferase family protein [Candidatus Dormibacteraeota bacterium]